MNKYTIKTDKAYFVASERVFDIYSEVTKYAQGICWRDLEKKVNSIFLPIQSTALSKSEF